MESIGEKQITVTFEPDQVSVEVLVGTTIRQAAAVAGVVIETPCGGQGSCGKCRVRTVGGDNAYTSAELVLLGPRQLGQGYRLACQARLHEALAVHVPDGESDAGLPILTFSSAGDFWAGDPPVCAHKLALAPPSLRDDSSDLSRLERVAGPLQTDLELLNHLPEQLRAGHYSGTAITGQGRLLDFIPGDFSRQCLAAAFDVGTTTLVASLLDLSCGTVLATSSCLNPQTAFADDVLSRISFISEAPQNLDRLHCTLIDALNRLLLELTASAHADPAEVYVLTFAGNTTMQHLLLGLDPTPIGVSPFTPAVSGPVEVRARDLGLTANPRAAVYIFPVIAGYVGGDTVAGILSTRFDEAPSPSLFLDIGTNGEMALNAGNQLTGTSCAAGPAFEGACIVHGMRAAQGAIEAIRFDDDVAVTVIGGGKPVGMCGSALIDLVAELLEAGILSESGMLLGHKEAARSTCHALRHRVRRFGEELAFVVVEAEETKNGQPIALFQRDVRQLQLAIAAVRSGLTLLMRRVGLEPRDLKSVLVAGAFGNYVRCANAQRIGLLPRDIEPHRIQFVGNSSLAGARQAALSLRARQKAHELSVRSEHVELSLDPAFEDVFVESLFFPMMEQTASA